MQWLLLGVVVIALLFMSTHYPKTAFGILGAMVIAAAVIVFSTREDAFQGRQRLPSEDIRIENAVVAEGYGGSYQLSARLVNAHAEILLKEAVISVTMLDCRGGVETESEAESTDDCAVIGQADERINIKIPAGQARDISRTMSFGDANPVGALRWQFKITETRS